MRGFSTAFLLSLLVVGASAQTTETCPPVSRGWTEIEYVDLMSGRYGIDREPVFAGECDKPSMHRRGH